MQFSTPDGTDISVELDAVTPPMFFEARKTIFESTMASQEHFKSLPPEEQQAITERVRRACECMYDTVDDWLPDAFDLSAPGSVISINFKMLLSNIKKEALANMEATSFRVRELRDELSKLIAEDDDEAGDS